MLGHFLRLLSRAGVRSRSLLVSAGGALAPLGPAPPHFLALGVPRVSGAATMPPFLLKHSWSAFDVCRPQLFEDATPASCSGILDLLHITGLPPWLLPELVFVFGVWHVAVNCLRVLMCSEHWHLFL